MANPFFPGLAFDVTTRDVVGGIFLYAYFGWTIMVLASRLRVKDPWMAWLPFANLYLLTQMARREWWWLFGFFIPYVNFFILALLWSDIGQRFHKNPWIGAAIILPIIGLFVPGYFVVTSETAHHSEPRA